MPSPKFLRPIKNLSDSHYAAGLTAIFLTVDGITAFHHEMWRDEIQAWLLARDSRSLIDLFHNLKYEGHPGLWHLCLMPLSRITSSPVIMQVFHLLIAATTVYLFARCSPFTRVQKFLFAFGYFSLYEYSIVCRNYALGVLLICLFCIRFRERYARFVLVGVVLFLLSHTSVHALIIAAVTGFALLIDYLFCRKRLLAEGKIDERWIWLGFGLIALGVITSALQLKPPADTGFAVGWRTRYDPAYLKAVIQIITRAFLPVPEPTLHFWGSRLLETYPLFKAIQLPLSGALIVWFSVVLLRKPTALLIYLSGTIGLLSFFYVKYFGSIRHHGFLFILFIMCAWIYRYCEEIERLKPINRFSTWWGRSLSPVLTGILLFHLIGGIIAVSMDNRYVFSYGKATAAYIKERHLQALPMVSGTDYAVSTVVGYLGKDLAYYSNGNRFGSFVVWDMARTRPVSDAQIVQDAKALQVKREADVLIILNHPLNPNLMAQNALIRLREFTGSTIGDEGFYLYLLPANDSGQIR